MVLPSVLAFGNGLLVAIVPTPPCFWRWGAYLGESPCRGWSWHRRRGPWAAGSDARRPLDGFPFDPRQQEMAADLPVGWRQGEASGVYL